jgi:hypothetical protein
MYMYSTDFRRSFLEFRFWTTFPKSLQRGIFVLLNLHKKSWPKFEQVSKNVPTHWKLKLFAFD